MRAKLPNYLRHNALVCQHFSNMQIHTSQATLKLHRDRLQDILNHLQETFPPKPIHPKMSSEEIMYHAGQASVVEYFKTLSEEE